MTQARAGCSGGWASQGPPWVPRTNSSYWECARLDWYFRSCASSLSHWKIASWAGTRWGSWTIACAGRLTRAFWAASGFIPGCGAIRIRWWICPGRGTGLSMPACDFAGLFFRPSLRGFRTRSGFQFCGVSSLASNKKVITNGGIV